MWYNIFVTLKPFKEAFMETIKKYISNVMYVDFAGSDGKKASCPECRSVIKFDPSYGANNYCDFCGCDIDAVLGALVPGQGKANVQVILQHSCLGRAEGSF